MTGRRPTNPGGGLNHPEFVSAVGNRNAVERRHGPSVVRQMYRDSRLRPGVGSGLRLQEAGIDAESVAGFKATERPISLTGRRIVRGLLCCGVLAILAIAHIQLRFLINDSRLQHQRMQRVHRELLQQYALLERANAQLSDYDRLRAYATQQLHMIEILERPTAYVTAEVREKYAPDTIMQARNQSQPKRAIAVTGESLHKAASDRILKLVDTGRAAFSGNSAQ